MQSINIPQGPRNPNGYSEEEVLRALRGIDGTRTLKFRYEHLDQNNVKIADLDNIEKCTVSQNFLAVVKRTATFEMKNTGDINFLTDRIKPYARLMMPAQTQPAHSTFDSTILFNNLNGVSGDEVTVDNMADHGTPANSISGGPAKYDSAESIGGGSSVEFPFSTTFQFNNQFANTTETLFRVFYKVSTDGSSQFFRLRFLDALQSGGGTLYQYEARMTGIGVGGTDNLSSSSGDLLGQWVRVDIEFKYSLGVALFKFFWGSNLHGIEPDLEIQGPNTLDREIATIRIEGANADSSGVWFDNPQFGDRRDVPEKPVPTDNDFVEWPLGVFMLSSPTKDSNEDDVVTRSIEGYDLSKIFIDDKLSERYTIPEGDRYIDHINSLLGDIPKVVEPIDTVAGKNREWPVGTEVENVINDITQSINYESLTFDEDGRAVIRPYVLPDERTPEYEYADDEVSVMYPEVTQELDLFDVANKWIVTVTNPDQDPITVSLENNDPANPTSIPRRGRTIVDFRDDMESTDYGSLWRKVRRLAFEASRQFEAVEFTTALMPIHSFNDVYRIKYSPLAIDDKYTEHTWDMPLEAGAQMRHRARRVVRLDATRDDSYIEGDLEITGALWADNFDYGRTTLPINQTNIPQRLTITGYDIKGTGRVRVFLTADSTVPGSHIREVTVMAETPTQFDVFGTRTSTVNTGIYWFVHRDP